MTSSTSFLAGPPAVAAQSHQPWTAWEKFLFRVFSIFMLLLIVPFDTVWLGKLFSTKTFFAFLNSLTGYRPNFYVVHTESGKWGFESFATWGIAFLIALVIGSVWTFFARNSKRDNYNQLYYWVRVIVRYRIAIGIIAFGFLKFFPMQMPDPSLSNLDTNFGDYNTYKIYWQVVGVSIWYEIVLGIVEILGGILMLFRRTAAIGAVLVAGVLYNIAHANIAYDGGVHVYSGLFVAFSLFVLVYYIPNLYKLFIKGENVQPNNYYPAFNKKWKRATYYSVKYVIIFVFTLLFGVLRYDVHYHIGQLKEPITPGLPNARGYYNVTEFRLNGKVLPYSPLDSVRWQNAIFEKWSTLIYKVNKPFPISLNNGGPNPKDVDRNYELAGIAGGRRFLFYTINTKNNQLILQDKDKLVADEDAPTNINVSSAKAKGKKKKGKKKEEKLTWAFSRPSPTRIILSGLNEHKDSIYVVLDKVDKTYPLKLNRSLSKL